MDINKADFLKSIKDKMYGAGKTVSNYNKARKSDNKSRENLKTLAMSKAKKKYKKKTGRTMTASRLADESQGGILSKPTRQYIKNKKSGYKKSKKKYDL